MRRMLVLFGVLCGLLYGMDTLRVYPEDVLGKIDLMLGGFGGGGEYYGDPRDTNYWHISQFYERDRIGEGLWDLPDTTTEEKNYRRWWELPEEGLWGDSTSPLGKPHSKAISHMREEGMRILHFPGATGRQGGCFDTASSKYYDDFEYYDWQALIGPTGGEYYWNSTDNKLDTISRDVNLTDTALTLPPRMQEYGFRQFITVCESVGAIALVPYTRFQDTTLYPYNEDDVYYKDFIANDFRHFCEYMWGDPDMSPWAEIRKKEGHPEPYTEIKYIEVSHDIYSHWTGWGNYWVPARDTLSGIDSLHWNNDSLYPPARKEAYYLQQAFRVIIGVFRQCQEDDSVFTSPAIDSVKLGVHLQKLGKYYNPESDTALDSLRKDFASQIYAIVAESLYADSTVYFLEGGEAVEHTMGSSDSSNFDFLVLYNYCVEGLAYIGTPWYKSLTLGLVDIKSGPSTKVRDTLWGPMVEFDSTCFIKSSLCSDERNGDSLVFRDFAIPHINYGELAMKELDSIFSVLSQYHTGDSFYMPYGILEWGNYVYFFKGNFLEALSVADYLLKLSEREQKPLFVTDWVFHGAGYNPEYLPPSASRHNEVTTATDTFHYVGNMSHLNWQTDLENDTTVRLIPSYVFEFFNKYYFGNEKLAYDIVNPSYWWFEGLDTAGNGRLKVGIYYPSSADTVVWAYGDLGSHPPEVDTNSLGEYADSVVLIDDTFACEHSGNHHFSFVERFMKNYFSFAISKDSLQNIYIIAINTDHDSIYDNIQQVKTFRVEFDSNVVFPIVYADTQFCLTLDYAQWDSFKTYVQNNYDDIEDGHTDVYTYYPSIIAQSVTGVVLPEGAPLSYYPEDSNVLDRIISSKTVHFRKFVKIDTLVDTTGRFPFTKDIQVPEHSIKVIKCYPKWQIVLREGWNHISIPFRPDDSTMTLREFLGALCDSIDLDSIKTYIKTVLVERLYAGRPVSRGMFYWVPILRMIMPMDIFEFVADSTSDWWIGKGIWVYSYVDTVLEINTTVIPGEFVDSYSYSVTSGWRDVGSIIHAEKAKNLVCYNELVSPAPCLPVNRVYRRVNFWAWPIPYRGYEEILPYYGYYALLPYAFHPSRLELSSEGCSIGGSGGGVSVCHRIVIIDISRNDSEEVKISFGVSDSAKDFYTLDEDSVIPPTSPWFDPDSDFSAYMWVKAPVTTRLSRSIVRDLDGQYSGNYLSITGADSVVIKFDTDSVPSDVAVNFLSWVRGWDVKVSDSFKVSPGSFKIRQIDLTSAVSGPWVYTEQGGSKYYKYWLLDNVILPQQYLGQKYAGVGEDYMFLTTPLAMDEDGVAYLKISGGGKSYPYYDHFNLVAIDIPAKGNFIPALCGDKLSVFDGDSALPLKLAVDDNGDTVTEVLRNDDDWTYVDTGSGSIEIWVDESLYTSGPLFLVFSPPPAPKGGNYSEIVVSYYDYTKKNWVKTGSVLGRIERFPVVEDVYYTSSGEDLRVKLEWNRGIRFDGIYVFRSAVDTAETVKTELISASHSRYGDVKDGLKWKGSLVGVFAGDDLVLGYKVSDKVPKDYVRYWVLESAGDSGVVGSDSFWAEIDTGTNKVIIYRRGSSTVIESAWVCIDDGDTGACGYTDVDGIYASPIDLDYTQDIYVSKFGFRPLKVQHVDYINGNEVWVYDVELLGDAFVGAGDTLIISAGTQVRTASNSDISTNQDDFNDNRVEIVVKGGHIEVRGTDDNPVVLAPKPGSSSTFQWEGVYCRDGGTANIENAVFKKSYMAVLGYNQPGRITVKGSRIEDLGLIFINYSQVDSADRVFLAESCYVGNRVDVKYCGDSCIVRACTLNGGYYEGATVQSSEYGMPHYENCHIEGKNYRCVRLLGNGKAKFEGCEFDGHKLYTSQQYFYITTGAELYLEDSRVDASDGRTVKYGIYELGSDTYIWSRWTTYDHYSTCVQTDNNADFGTLSDPGHNCFLDDDGYVIVNEGSDTIPAEWNYYDTLLFKGSVEHDSVDTVCHPDSTLHRRIVEDNKPTLPKEFALGPAIPNPFNSSVELHFEVPEKARVRLEIWDVLGRRVRVVFDGEVEAGAHSVVWDGKDSRGGNAPSGVYFYRLVADKVSLVRRMTLIR